MMPLNGSCPARNASTHSSLAALNTAGAVPPELPDVPGEPDRGERLVSSGKNSQVDALRPVEGGRRVRDPLGPAEAEAIGTAHVGRAWPGRAWSRR